MMISRLYQSNVVNASLVVVGAVLTFLPFYVGEPSYVEDTIIAHASSSELFRYACVALFSLVIPLIIDLFFDVFSSYSSWCGFVANRNNKAGTGNNSDNNKPASVKLKVDDCSFDLLERSLLICGNIIYPITIFVSASYSSSSDSNTNTTTKAALILLCARKCRLMLVSGALGCTLGRREHIMSKPLVSFCIILYIVSAAAGGFAQNSLGLQDGSSPGPGALYYVNLIFAYIPAIIVLACCAWWLLRIVLVAIDTRLQGGVTNMNASSWVSRLRATLGDNYTSSYFAYRVGFIVILLLWVILSASLNGKYKNVTSYDAQGLFWDVVPYILFVLAQSALSMRLVKFEAVQGLVSVY
jgi:hypothetical protein